jgi:hypothetical protein
MRAYLGLAAALVLAVAGRADGQGQKVMVIVGAVFYPGNAPAPDIPVGLYCTAAKGCAPIRPQGRTKQKPLGVYAVTDVGVAVNRLYVIYDDTASSFVADPVTVDLACQGVDPCVVFADDLVLRSLPPAGNPQLTAAYIDSFAKTNDIKVAAKAVPEGKAAQDVLDKAAYVVGITSPPTQQDAYVEQVVTHLKQVSKSNTIKTATDAKAIKNHIEYQRTKDIRIEPKDLLEPGRLSPEKFQKLMILPHDQIPKDGVDPQILGKLIQEHAGDKDHVSIGIAPPAGPVRTVVDVPGKPSVPQLQQLVGDHPEIRQWAVLNQLTKDKKLSPAQQAIVADRLHRDRPVVIHGKNK